MVLAGDRLFMAGPPDVVDPEDPLAAFEGKKGCHLWSYRADNGKREEKYHLEHLPVFDGMIAVKNKILISTEDGSLICLEGEAEE
jgi:outer membrane protein assembly factor BamB